MIKKAKVLWERCYSLHMVFGKLITAAKSFHKKSTRFKNWRKKNKEFNAQMVCVMSPWLFNISMDGVLIEMNRKVLGEGAVLKTVPSMGSCCL